MIYKGLGFSATSGHPALTFRFNCSRFAAFKKKKKAKLQVTKVIILVRKTFLVCSLCAFSFHKLHCLLFDCLDALWGAMLLFVLQVALEEELDLFH